MSAAAMPSLEALRGWLNTGLLGGILAVMAFVVKPVVDGLIKARELKLQEDKANRDGKLAEDKEDRAGWAELISELRQEIGVLREDNKTLRSEMNDVRAENIQLRGEVRQMHGLLASLGRADLAGAAMAEAANSAPAALRTEKGQALVTNLRRAYDVPKSGIEEQD